MQLSATMSRSALILATSLLLASNAPVLAKDSPKLGTAGSYRGFAVQNCEKGFEQQMRGACDPPPVDTTQSTADQIQEHLDRAQRLLLMFRSKQAREAGDQAIALDPNNLSALKFRSRLAMYIGDSDIAWRDANAAVKIKPDDSDALATRGELRWQRQDLGLALLDLGEAIKANPKNADAYRIRGRALMIAGREEEALADWNAALALEPDFDLARLFRSQTYLRMRNFKAAVDDTSILIDADQQRSSALQVRAIAYAALDNPSKAVEDLTLLIGDPRTQTPLPAANPTLRPLLLQRMILLFKLDREDDARKDLTALLERGGKQGVLQIQLFLRQNGYPDVEIDGRNNERLQQAIFACTSNPACLKALTQRI
jgi:tetratricopeptide (TPR) repeat protein